MRFLVFICTLFLWVLPAQASELTQLIDHPSDTAVVLVGGFDGDYRYFEPWMPELEATQARVYGFVHNHRATSMTDGAHDLAQALSKLSADGVRSVIVLAHSMGGLVADKALHDLGEVGASQFASIELHAYGTPWGGFFIANFARWVPGSQFVATKLGFPMGSEIGSRSDFMQSLQAPLPHNVSLALVESVDDEIAQPKADSAIAQYDSIRAQALSVQRLSHVDHCGYVRALTFASVKAVPLVVASNP